MMLMLKPSSGQLSSTQAFVTRSTTGRSFQEKILLESAAVSKCDLVVKWVKDTGLKWGAVEKLLHVSTHPPAIVF